MELQDEIENWLSTAAQTVGTPRGAELYETLTKALVKGAPFASIRFEDTLVQFAARQLGSSPDSAAVDRAIESVANQTFFSRALSFFLAIIASPQQPDNAKLTAALAVHLLRREPKLVLVHVFAAQVGESQLAAADLDRAITIVERGELPFLFIDETFYLLSLQPTNLDEEAQFRALANDIDPQLVLDIERRLVAGERAGKDSAFLAKVFPRNAVALLAASASTYVTRDRPFEAAEFPDGLDPTESELQRYVGLLEQHAEQTAAARLRETIARLAASASLPDAAE